MSNACKPKPKIRRRKKLAGALVVNTPTAKAEREDALMRLSTRELKALSKATGTPIPKTKAEMAERLATVEAIAIAVTTEAVAFDGPKAA